MIDFKPTVNSTNVHPAIWIAVGIAYQLRATITLQSLLTITSMGDGDHMETSLHYSVPCKAVDLRTHDLSLTQAKIWADDCKLALEPMGFDIVHHKGDDGVPMHLHIEYQPKANEVDWLNTSLMRRIRDAGTTGT